LKFQSTNYFSISSSVSRASTVSGGFFGGGADGVDAALAVVAPKWTNRSDSASKLLGNALAFRAMNVRAAANWTLVRADDVNQFHDRTNLGRLEPVGWREKNSPRQDG
jgi:hypothetical protein